MATFKSSGTDKDVKIQPTGTGRVVVGTGAAAATVASDGDNDLVLQTGNATTGSITIADGANGNIAIMPNGTGEVDISKVNIDGGTIDDTAIGGTTPAAVSATTLNVTASSASEAVVITQSGAGDALRITQTGSGNALVVEDDNSNPDSTPFVINNAGNVMVGQTSTAGAKLVVGGYTGGGATYASSTGIGVYGNSHFENGLKVGSLVGGTIESGVTFPAGHILQCLNATVTNVDNTATTSNYVADVISQITIKSGNYVKLTVFLNFKINGGTANAVGSVRIHKGTVAFPSTLLLATGTIGDYQNISGINLPVTLSVIDESPAITTPDYCFKIERDSLGTSSVQIIGTPVVILEEINV